MASDTSLCSSFALVAPCFAVEYEVLRNSRRSFFLRLSVLVIFSLLCFASSLVTAALDAVPMILRKWLAGRMNFLVFIKLPSSNSDF